MERLKRQFIDAEQRRVEYVDAQTRELAFALDSDHYHDDPGNQKQPGRVKQKGRQTFGLIRHKSGQFVRSELHVSVIPAQYRAHSALATAAKALIVERMTNPETRFKQVREACATGALAARQWCYKWEYDPDCKKVLPTLVDGRKFGWTPGYLSHHDPRCPWFYEVGREPTESLKLKRNWRNTKELKGDAGTTEQITRSNLPTGDVDLAPAASPKTRPSLEESYTTYVLWYERGYKSEARTYKPGSLNELKDGERYLACMTDDRSGCGYESQTAKQLVKEGALESIEEMPEFIEGGCPDCDGDVHLITHSQDEYVSRSDNTLTIFAPYEGSGGVELWSGPWPHMLDDDVQLSTYVVYTCYVHPAKPMGASETSLNWTPQLAHNLVMRLGLEHMMLARPYMQIPRGAVDYQGNRWEFGPEQGLGIYADPMAPPGTVSAVQAPGLPPAWATLEGRLDGQLRADLGSTDFAMAPEMTRDIPVGTKQLQQQEGEVPILAQTARWQFEDGLGLAAAYELMRATYTDEELLQIQGDDGQVFPAMIRAAELPRMHITITTDPNTLAIKGEDLDGLARLMALPRPQRRLAARRFNIPLTELQRLERDEDEEVQRQARLMAPPTGPPVPGARPPIPMGPPGASPPGMPPRFPGLRPVAPAPAMNGAAA